MNLVEGLRIALTALAANTMRSVLTTLGVVIGVAAVIAMVALGTGAQRDIQANIAKLGSNLLFVAPGQAERGQIWRAFGSAETLPVSEAMRIRAEVPEVAGVAPELNRNAQVKYGSLNGDFRIVGTLPDYNFVRSAKFEQGKFFTRLDEEGRRRVCVLGYAVWERLFPNGGWAVGKRIKIKSIPFTVLGVLTERGGYGREDEVIVMPLSTYRQRLDNSRYVRLIAVTAREGVDNAAAEAALRKWLRRQHRLRPGEPDDFSFASQQDILNTVQESSRIFTLLLAGIASISLVVGGIGIMNIMLVTVTERTREIGIRKALGARRRDIQLQFLTESVVLSVFGGGLGVALGVWLANLVKSFGLNAYVSTSSVLLAFGCAAGIGIFFGYYPASQAGKLDPIQALRYE
ncbi:MAG: ABC transporter permease [Fimbriimonadaceae bacterium]|nr:ABC transporter permease [Fimbriimonadaceae bacterium]